MVLGEDLQWGKVCNGFSVPLQIFRGGEDLQWGGKVCNITPELKQLALKLIRTNSNYRVTSPLHICIYISIIFMKVLRRMDAILYIICMGNVKLPET